MKPFIATLTLALLLLPTTAAQAQSRSRRTSPQRARGRAAASQASRADAEQKEAARQKLVLQLKNLTQFVYLYGRFSKDLELSGGRGSAEAARTRAALVDTLRGIREGLDQLEGQFRTTRGLEPYYRRLSGVAELAAGAEQLAAANQLDRAGRTLLEVANRLTDVLAEM